MNNELDKKTRLKIRYVTYSLLKLKVFLRIALSFSYGSICILIIENVSLTTGGKMTMTVKEGYILLTDTGSLLTKLIKLYTKKSYNHASIAFDSKLSEVYSFGRKSVRNPFIGGFIKEDLKSSLFDKADCVIYSFEGTDVQFEMMKQYIKGINAQKKQYSYNFLGLFGFIIKRPIKRNKAFFCSQFVASVLEEGKIVKFKIPISLVAPHNLQHLSKFQLVYQGKLKTYTKRNEDKEVYVPSQCRSIGM